MELTAPWNGLALVNMETFLLDSRVMAALADALPGASPEDIAQAVEDYLLANPVTVTADEVIETVTNKILTAAERTKLGGIATGATANQPDSTTNAAIASKAALVHTHAIADTTGLQSALDGKQPAGSYASSGHVHTSAQITDFTEAVQDAVAVLLAQGTNVTLSYDDAANTLTINSAGGGGLDAEAARDAIGVALLGTGVITVTVNDAADTITISSTATANSTDAALRDRATHTGTQSADTVVDGTTNKAFTATEKTKLSGVATGATANQSDATTNAAIALKANAANAALTGTPTAPTPTNGDNSTKIATTAFIQTTLAAMAGIYAPLASPAFTGTPTGITKAHVGLGSVDNTSDAAKPVSTAQAAAISAAVAPKVSSTTVLSLEVVTAAAHAALEASPPAGFASTLYVIVG